MEIYKGRTVSIPAADFAAADGFTLTTGAKWAYDLASSNPPLEMSLTTALLSGTPGSTRTYQIILNELTSAGGWVSKRTTSLVVVNPPADVEITAPAPVFDNEARTYTVPEAEGVIYSVDGSAKEAGTYSASLGETVSVGAVARVGYTLAGETTWTHTFTESAPEPEPEPEPETPGKDVPAQTVARFLGHPDNPKVLALAEEHLRVVTTFVRAYTRGRGFVNGVPGADLQDVIVSCTARNLVNPGQYRAESLGSQSVTYARIDGFTLAEQAVLHLYRRRAA